MGTKRSIVTCIIFSIITCGIYGLYWFIKLTDETNELATDGKTSGGVSALVFTLITCGIYGFYWSYKLGEKVDNMSGKDGNSAILYLVLQLFGLGIINYCLAQDAINKKCA